MSKKSANRRTAEEAIRFLDTHMLDPTPGNYAFAYLYMTGVSGSLRKTVDGMVFDGVRLKQDVVDELMSTTTETAGAAVPSDMDEIRETIRRQALSVADLTQRSLSDTSAFGRELQEGAEQALSGVDLAGIIRTMAERTAMMERKLAETAKETERLRMDLDAARDDASRDALTNLPNRRAVERQIEKLGRAAEEMAVAFCDIDHFKSINDRFGHAVGDRVLKAVAETLSETMDPHIVARFGGEEFVVLLPGISADEAFRLVEQAREAVAQRNFRVRETDQLIGTVTFSAGVAQAKGDPEEALRVADKSLYEAKNSGRNRTVWRAAA